MKTILKLGKLNLPTIIQVGCYLGFLIILVPWIISKYFFNGHSLQTSQYVFLGILAFLFLLIGIVIPYVKKIMHFLGIPDHANLLDGLLTILLIIFSGPFLLILCVLTLPALRMKSLYAYRYWIFHISVSIAIILLLARTRQYGKRDQKAKIIIANHTSPLDYLLISLFMGTSPWNIVAGINLRINKPTFADRIIAATIGKMVEDYSISIDRTSEASKQNTARRIMEELENKKNIAIFPEGTRTPKKTIEQKHTLLQEFQNGAFRIAWGKGIPIQPLVFDWPVIWRGKGDDWWGVHPCRIDAYFLPAVEPTNFRDMEEFKKACWDAMEEQLKKSEKIKLFLSNK